VIISLQFRVYRVKGQLVDLWRAHVGYYQVTEVIRSQRRSDRVKDKLYKT
jgi:hypothetical protein